MWDELTKGRKTRPYWTKSQIVVKLKHLDRELDSAFNAFEKLLIEKHGSTLDGWKTYEVAQGGVCTITEKTFLEQTKALGYSGDPLALFKMLRPDTGRNHLVYKDLWPAQLIVPEPPPKYI